MTVFLPKSKSESGVSDAAAQLLGTTNRGMRLWAFIGIFIVVLFFGGLGAWAALAPLHSAAIAQGEVVVESSRQTVQHKEGGIIQEIVVDSGQKVSAGDVLVRLDATQERARLDLLMGRFHTSLAREARLTAELKGRSEIDFPDKLLEARDAYPSVREMIQTQQELFQERRTSIEGEISVLEKRIDQHNEEIAGLRAQIASIEQQTRLIDEETASVARLVEKGLERKPRLLALQRRQAELEGTRGDLLSRIARAKASISEAEARILQLRNKRREEVATQLRETRDQLFEVRERLHAQRDVVARTEIRAPMSGTVVDMQYHTAGGVISPGSKVMDIVPGNDRMMIEARVRPSDIDVVRAGLQATVRFTAYSQRTTPSITGTVTRVSADRLVDEQSGNAYYKARIEVNQDQVSQLKNVELYPGMPADVMIRTGQRTALDYILSPITDTLARSMREQ